MRLPVFCGRDCGGDACPLLAQVEDGRVVGMAHNPAAGPYLRACPKGYALPSMHYSPHRIRTPLLREGPKGSGRFIEASWDEALSRVARGLASCRSRYGNASIFCLSSAGSTGALHNTEKLSIRFLRATGGCTTVSGNYSSNAATFALKKALGPDYFRSGFDALTVMQSALVILWGANVLEARLGSELPARLLQAAKAGVPFVSIDPRRTSTTTGLKADWIPIKPGTDVAMMYAILHEFLSLGIVNRPYVAERALGFEELSSFVLGREDGLVRNSAWAAEICGVDAQTIRQLAKRWTEKRPVVLIPGYSIQRTESGEEAMRLCLTLQLASGNFGLPGGSTGSINNKLPGPRVGSIQEGSAGEGGSVPVLRWPDAILEGYEGATAPIKAVYTAGGNFINQGADITKNRKAFESLDFAVCHELFMTPTAQYCDVILPGASTFQKEDIGTPWAGNYLLYKPRILPMDGLERSDYDIFTELASRLGQEEAFTEGLSESGWIDRFLKDSEIKDIDAFKASGIYFGAEQERCGLKDFAENPTGFPLRTASGKVELSGPRWRGWAEEPEGQPARREFFLISPKERLRVHSQWGDRPDDVRSGRLTMHVDDARDLGLRDDDEVELFSATGSTTYRLSLSGDIARGVVSAFEGSWSAGADGQPLPGSPNYLTSTQGTRESVSCIMHGIPVAIRIPKAQYSLAR